MPVVELKRERAAPAGEAMDRAIARPRGARRIKLAAGAALALGLGAFVVTQAPIAAGERQTVEAGQLTISTVTRGTFEDFVPLRGRVTPLTTVYLDATQGGRVEQLLVEDGAMVEKGQLLAVLSNAELQLSTLARQTEVEQQLNNMRSQELALAQSRTRNERDLVSAELEAAKAERLYAMQAELAERGFVPARTFKDTTDEAEALRRRVEVLREGAAVDERLQSSQLAQLRTAASALNSSLAIARASLDQLNIRAPVAGQLSAFTIQLGQSLGRGERLGQIDSAGANKLLAGVDEYHLGRVEPGQAAVADWNGERVALKVTKVLPQVRGGQFDVEMTFVGAEPQGLRRGQTLPVRLTLSDPVPATLIPAGSFYNDTGGSWIFVVAPGGEVAEKRPVRLGRRNADHIEVLDGLEPGERVVTSPYTGFRDKDRLALASN